MAPAKTPVDEAALIAELKEAVKADVVEDANFPVDDAFVAGAAAKKSRRAAMTRRGGIRAKRRGLNSYSLRVVAATSCGVARRRGAAAT